MQPVPGSRLWEECISKSLVSEEMDFSSLALDLNRKDIDWTHILYLNNEIMPLKKFIKIVDKIKDEFCSSSNIAKSENNWQKTYYQKATGIFNKSFQKGQIFLSFGFKKVVFKINRILYSSHKKTSNTPSNKLSGLRLYVGCGDDRRDGFIGCDFRPVPNASIICKAWEVSFFCKDVKEIYSRHMLEHLTLPQVEATFRDWLRALSTGGKIHIIVPNIDCHIEQWQRAIWDEDAWSQKFSDARYSYAGLWGWQRECDEKSLSDSGENAYWDVHKSGYNKNFLTFLLTRNGFVDVKCEIVENVHLVGYAKKL
jgi:predicted SAM-dependent methyltransferase